MSHPTPDPSAFERAKAAFLDGLAHLKAGRAAEAETAFISSLAQVPGRVSTLVNLAATRLALGRPAEALATADEVLDVEPLNGDALLHRAIALRALARQSEATSAFKAALALRPEWTEGWLQLGLSHLELAQPQEALHAFDRALALDATLTSAWTCRADLLRDMGHLDEARHAYQQALAHGADAQLVNYCLASLGTGASPSTAPRAYVETLFDSYAGEFEQHVVKLLRYRVPQGLVEPLLTLHPQPFDAGLDLGCGTGLCGPLVRPHVGRLVGVDLSAGMLAQARADGVYDELVQADIVQHLRDSQARYDLVLAADVFIYVGDLEPVFAALSGLMPAGGIFCFSAETPADQRSAGFVLQPSLRYAHRELYLRDLAARHGFEVLRMVNDTVREEQRQPIEGLLVHLQRSA